MWRICKRCGGRKKTLHPTAGRPTDRAANRGPHHPPPNPHPPPPSRPPPPPRLSPAGTAAGAIGTEPRRPTLPPGSQEQGHALPSGREGQEVARSLDQDGREAA